MSEPRLYIYVKPYLESDFREIESKLFSFGLSKEGLQIFRKDLCNNENVLGAEINSSTNLMHKY